MVTTAEGIRIIDRNCEELGIAVIQLMENAGAAAAKIILAKYPEATSVAVCCGAGNNGGDGFVVARHLAAANRKVKVFLFGNEVKIRSEAANRNYQILKQMEHSIEITQIADSTNLAKYKNKIYDVDLLVDSLLGIGLTTEPHEPIKSAIKVINAAKLPVVSIDMPSGLFSDVPKKQKIMIQADTIITFHDTKPCLEIDELKAKTIICDIGVPPEAEFFVGKGDLSVAIPKRKKTSHKGENGTILVVGGSISYSGAPVLSSRAALRTGADLVVTCIPESIAPSARSDSPNLIVRSFEGEYLIRKHMPEILKLFKKFDAMVLGPGISTNPETLDFVRELIQKIPKEKPLIIDADALKAIKDHLSILKDKTVILTPHQGEFKIVFGEGLPNKWNDRPSYVQNLAKEHSLTILLKGKYDIISDGYQVKVNRTGHEGMTTGGTGDVLAGILGTIASVNNNYFRAACASAYLAGKAGELAAEDFGNSLLATDVVEKIPDILMQFK
ncbi:MAG: NAD(P)H-hydrate dehydratase [Candidatus Heimdallarchaeota archaeon]